MCLALRGWLVASSLSQPRMQPTQCMTAASVRFRRFPQHGIRLLECHEKSFREGSSRVEPQSRLGGGELNPRTNPAIRRVSLALAHLLSLVSSSFLALVKG